MPRYFDVCNGDADGLCAVVQWRLAHPEPATLVTGLKREIDLLGRLQADAGDEVLVCDVSMQRNLPALQRLLACGVRVRYFDHHATGEVPRHPGLQVHIDLSPRACTSVLMDRHLHGRFRAWAVVGAFGDNLAQPADELADALGLSLPQRHRLRALGESINYNAYGDDERDVHVPPAQLYRTLAAYADPFELLAHEKVCRELHERREADLQQARALAAWRVDASGRIFLLPDAPWARRVSGCLANELARGHPGLAHAVVVPTPRGDLRVSVRAPLTARGGAAELCARFGGSGRAGAGGIDALPRQALDRFAAAFASAPWTP
ncbi:hypothetical protein M8A51_10120 [Schlegelella sp. S2-27]|uniref:Acetyltransferase n=1 Tax=Caldimonas mangrovi TaxID=2944811 RepID=A0ABT0YMD8_9BURK|nr:hypothetical protein [Caldimonas mangrovi]MCM5679887.1 hypothetical protein [Caldimonas mangrovi]